MSDTLYALNDSDLSLLKRMFADYQGGRLTYVPPTDVARRPPLETYIAQASGSIGKLTYDASGHSVPGSGVANVFGLDGSLVDQDLSVTAYNLWDQAIYSGDWLVLARDPFSGQFFAVLVFPKLSSSSMGAISTSGGGGGGGGSGGGGSGNGVTVVTDVTCGGSTSGDDDGLNVTDGTLSATVTIGGVTYPVTLTLTGGGSV